MRETQIYRYIYTNIHTYRYIAEKEALQSSNQSHSILLHLKKRFWSHTPPTKFVFMIR